jgi:hypothetical protein
MATVGIQPNPMATALPNRAMTITTILERRVLTEDALGLIVQRISEPHIARLNQWFQKRGGGDNGQALLREAPMFDTFLARLVGPLSVEGRTSLQSIAQDQFCCGLMTGALLRDAIKPQSPFYQIIDLATAMHVIGGAGTTFREVLDETGEAGPIRWELGEALQIQLPQLDLSLHTAFRLSGATGPYCQRIRFLFYLGLATADIDVTAPRPRTASRKQPNQGLLDFDSDREAAPPSQIDSETTK